MKINEVVQKINTNHAFSVQVDGNICKRITDVLIKDGWESFQPMSKYGIVPYEKNLRRGDKYVRIIESSFMGPCTDIFMYTKRKDHD